MTTLTIGAERRIEDFGRLNAEPGAFAGAAAAGSAPAGGAAAQPGTLVEVPLRRSDRAEDFLLRVCEAAADQKGLIGETRRSFLDAYARVENLRHGELSGAAAWNALRAEHLPTGIQTRPVRVAVDGLLGAADAAQAARTPGQAAAEQVIKDLKASSWLGYSQADQRKIVDDLKALGAQGSEAFNRGLDQIAAEGLLDDLLSGVRPAALKRELIDVLAVNANDSHAATIRKALEAGDIDVASGPGGAIGATIAETPWQTRFNLVRLGVPGVGPETRPADTTGLVSTDPTRPFTGVGATGVNPADLSVPLTDQGRLMLEQLGIVSPTLTPSYDNPIPGDLNQYLAGLSPAERTGQARLLLNQPISTPMRELWGDRPPTRSQVIEAAARRYSLDPALVSSFLLAEQRDQSRNEDAKDWTAAVNAGHDSSVGLGQVLISNVNKVGILSDSLSPATLRHSSTAKNARLLSDDAVNIFAVARYIRSVANAGATKTREGLPTTTALYPGVDFAKYALPSSQWPDDNIRALGSEYTSLPWDDRKLGGWGDFVFEARRDVVASGVFR